MLRPCQLCFLSLISIVINNPTLSLQGTVQAAGRQRRAIRTCGQSPALAPWLRESVVRPTQPSVLRQTPSRRPWPCRVILDMSLHRCFLNSTLYHCSTSVGEIRAQREYPSLPSSDVLGICLISAPVSLVCHCIIVADLYVLFYQKMWGVSIM